MARGEDGVGRRAADGRVMLPPGSTIGILGGGQLGRMLALAAAPLGLHVHVHAPEPDSPAFAVAGRRTVAAYDDVVALEAFARAVDVVTTEFENVPAATAEVLARLTTVRPNPRALAIAQDRLPEKRFVADLGIPVPKFEAVDADRPLADAVARIGLPSVLKTRRLGYDGKGQVVLHGPEDVVTAFDRLGRQAAILEAFVPFSKEVSVVAARGADGAFAAYDVTENVHRHHILATSTAPAAIPAALADAARAHAALIAEALDYVGVFAVEFFLVGDGEDARLFVNEIAPRVHNSGHWTIEGAETSQFEQHIRAVAGWPLGSTRRRFPVVVMENLIGDDVARWSAIAAEPNAHLHLYGKAEARPGRKMGPGTRTG